MTILLLVIISVGAYAYLRLRPQEQIHPQTYEKVNASKAKMIIDSTPSLTILDVRTREEFSAEHLDGAVNIPLQELEERLNELDRSKPVLVYCHSGGRSRSASEILIKHRVTQVYTLEGGITSWMASGYPTVGEVKTTTFTSASLTTPREAFPTNATFEDLSGKVLKVDDFRGKIVILEFMFTDCPACRSQTSHLKEVYDSFGRDLVIVSVSVNPEKDTQAILQSYVQEYGAYWVWARDVNYSARTRLNTQGYPTIFVLDREGRIGFRAEGPLSADVLSLILNYRRLKPAGSFGPLPSLYGICAVQLIRRPDAIHLQLERRSVLALSSVKQLMEEA